MTVFNSTPIVMNGLVFHYDMNNQKSYSGPPLTTAYYYGGKNAVFPTYPSGWGTYNTNQYGSGTYFSIGTISSVSSNIITCNGHPLRTYDVVQPQTSGGGVTAGTNYLVRKWDANTFSLYAYDNTQDSYDPFSAQVNLNNDTRISVSSGITNMWWGYPHLPNSGIMKQIVKDGFQYKGRVHDCMRIHWYRPDGIKDGMAYGNTPYVSSGYPYTVCFYHRAATPNAIGKTAYFERWTNGDDTTQSFTVGKDWKKFSYTFTPSQNGTTNFYWFNTDFPAQSAFDIAEITVHQGTGSTEMIYSNIINVSDYYPVSRNADSVIKDLTGNNTITASSLTYNSDGTFSFNGSSNYIDVTNNLGTVNAYTFCHWSRRDAENKMPIGYRAGATFYQYGDNSWAYTHGGTLGEYYYPRAVSIPLGTWGFYCITYDGAYVRIYRNGVFEGQQASTGSADFTNGFRIGYWASGSSYYYQGAISTMAFYNRALSAAEVKQNFNALRGRYGL